MTDNGCRPRKEKTATARGQLAVQRKPGHVRPDHGHGDLAWGCAFGQRGLVLRQAMFHRPERRRGSAVQPFRNARGKGILTGPREQRDAAGLALFDERVEVCQCRARYRQ